MLGDKGLGQAICHFAWGIGDSFIHTQLKKKMYAHWYSIHPVPGGTHQLKVTGTKKKLDRWQSDRQIRVQITSPLPQVITLHYSFDIQPLNPIFFPKF